MSNPGASAQTPPGWYPDPAGVTRWWDGTQWSEQTQGAAAQHPVGVKPERPRIPDDTPVDNVWVWVAALASFVTVPMIFLLDMRGFIKTTIEAGITGDTTGIMDATFGLIALSLGLAVVGWVVTALTIFASYRDYKRLLSLGVERPFHWGFSFFTLVVGILVYLIGRHVVLRKVVRTAGWPMWVHLALLALTFVFLTIWIVWLMQMMMGELVHLV